MNVALSVTTPTLRLSVRVSPNKSHCADSIAMNTKAESTYTESGTGEMILVGMIGMALSGFTVGLVVGLLL